VMADENISSAITLLFRCLSLNYQQKTKYDVVKT